MKRLKIILSLLLTICLSVLGFTNVDAADTYSINDGETVTVVFNVNGVTATSGTATFTVSDGLEIVKEWFGLKGTSSASFDGNSGSFTYNSATDINGAYVYVTVKGLKVGNQSVSVDVNFKNGNTTIYTATSSQTINVSCGEHEFGDWIIINQGNCITEGTKERSCIKCGYTEKESIGLGNHFLSDDVTIVKNATSEANGYISGVCKYCGNNVELETHCAYYDSENGIGVYCSGGTFNDESTIRVNQLDLNNTDDEKIKIYNDLLQALGNRYYALSIDAVDGVNGPFEVTINLPSDSSNEIQTVVFDENNKSTNNIDSTLNDNKLSIILDSSTTIGIVDVGYVPTSHSSIALPIIIIIIVILLIAGGIYFFFNKKKKRFKVKKTKKNIFKNLISNIKKKIDKSKKAHEIKKEEAANKKKLLEISKAAKTVKTPTKSLRSNKVFDALGIDKLEYKNVLNITNKYEFRLWLLDNADKEKECYIKVIDGEPYDDGNFYYLDALEVALCFGWTSGKPTLINGEAMQKFVRRAKDSYWSELDKQRVRRLDKLGLMKDTGKAVLPTDMSINGFVPDKDVIDEFKKVKVYSKFKKLPALYQRVRLSELMYLKKTNKNTYKELLRKTLEATFEEKTIGEYNDYGRLED